jgi:hypothetical protein
MAVIETLDNVKDRIAKKYEGIEGTIGTDAPYRVLNENFWGKAVIEDYTKIYKRFYPEQFDLIDEEYANELAIALANADYFITSDSRAVCLSKKYEAICPFDTLLYELAANSIVYGCITIPFIFERLISYLSHLDFDIDSVRKLIEDLEGEEVDKIRTEIFSTINDDYMEKMSPVYNDVYANAHDKEEYLYYNEKD